MSVSRPFLQAVPSHQPVPVPQWTGSDEGRKGMAKVWVSVASRLPRVLPGPTR